MQAAIWYDGATSQSFDSQFFCDFAANNQILPVDILGNTVYCCDPSEAYSCHVTAAKLAGGWNYSTQDVLFSDNYQLDADDSALLFSLVGDIPTKKGEWTLTFESCPNLVSSPGQCIVLIEQEVVDLVIWDPCNEVIATSAPTTTSSGQTQDAQFAELIRGSVSTWTYLGSGIDALLQYGASNADHTAYLTNNPTLCSSPQYELSMTSYTDMDGNIDTWSGLPLAIRRETTSSSTSLIFEPTFDTPLGEYIVKLRLTNGVSQTLRDTSEIQYTFNVQDNCRPDGFDINITPTTGTQDSTHETWDLLVANLVYFSSLPASTGQTCFDAEGKLGFKMISLVLDSGGNQSVLDDTVYGGQVGTQVAADATNMPLQVSGTSLTFKPQGFKDQPGQYAIELRWYYKNIDDINGGGTGCTDIAGGDADGNSCNVYTINTCGIADSAAFTSSSDCCACGGGTTHLTDGFVTTCTDTDTLPSPALLDVINQSCSSYTSADCNGGLDVTGGFQAKQHCCACGGGTKYDTFQEDNAFLKITDLVFTVENDPLSDIILLVGENPATIDFCAASIEATGQSSCGVTGTTSQTEIFAQVLTGQSTPDMTRFNAQTASTLIPTYTSMTTNDRYLDGILVSPTPLVDTFRDSDAQNMYGWWTISFRYCTGGACGNWVDRKLLLFNPCRALVYTKDITSPFFSDGYIADYEDYAVSDLPGAFLITDQINDNKADIHWTEFAANSNTCPPFTVTRTISDEYTGTDGLEVPLVDPAYLAIIENMFTITDNTHYNFNRDTYDYRTPLGTFDVETTMTQATPAADVVNYIDFTISFQDSCKFTNLQIVDTKSDQTLQTNSQIGYKSQTTLEWAMIDTTNMYVQMANLQVTRSRPSYIGECPRTLKIRLTLDNAIDSNGADLVVNAGQQESGSESDWPTDEPNMPVRIQGGNIVFQPKATDEAGIYTYTFGHIQYDNNQITEISYFQYQHQLVFEVQEAQYSYPGTQGAQLTCEGYHITELMCTEMPECCNWQLDKCYSSVSQNECTFTSPTGVWNAAKDDFTEQLTQFLVIVADDSPHEVNLAVVGYINEQQADIPDLALTFDLKTASEFTTYTTTSTEGMLSLNPTALHASLTHYFIMGTLTNGDETYELTMNIQVNEGESNTEVEASQETPEDSCQEDCKPNEEEEQSECIDTAGEATDVNGYGCELRDQDLSYCGLDDDEDFFISQSMCCSCHDLAVAGDNEDPTEAESEEHIEELIDQVKDSTPEQRQAILNELLQYNMMYLASLQVQSSETNGEVEIPPEPTMTSTNSNSQGNFAVVFDAELIGPSMIQALDGRLNGEGLAVDNSQTGRRLLNESARGTNATNVTDASEQVMSFNLASYLLFEIVRGSENSAALSQLNFTVDSTSIEGSILNFKATFDSPLDVSIGDEKDKLVISVKDTTFFSNKITGIHIAEGSETSIILPKMIPNEMTAIMDVAQVAVEKAGQTILVVQLLITAFLAISLKSVWNLMNVIQILAYMRFFTDWPAPMIDLFTFMDNAITLKPFSDLFFNLGQDQFEIASQKVSDEALRNAGVQDIQLFKSLGVFAFIILALLIGVLIFFVLKLCKDEKYTKIKDKLHAKLFFNSFLRYMTVSNLKLNYTVWGFMIVYYKSHNLVYAGICGLILYLIALYPGFMVIGLLRNHHRIEEKKFKTAYNALFNEINTHSKQALVYEAIFCIRRFFIVAVNISLSSKVPLNNFEKPRYLYKILIFIGIQSVYLWYINDTRPHTNNIFNRLEFFNEGSLMLLAYLMIGYSDVMPHNTSGSLLAGIMSVIVVVLIASANLFVLGYLTFVKLKVRFKNSKAKKHSVENTVSTTLGGSSTLTVVQEQSDEEKEDCKVEDYKVEDYKQDVDVFPPKDPLLVVAKMTQRSEFYHQQRRKVLEMREQAIQEGGIVSSEANGIGKLCMMEVEQKEKRRQEKQKSRVFKAIEDDIIELNLKKRRACQQVESQRVLIGQEVADGMKEEIERKYTEGLKVIEQEHVLIKETGVCLVTQEQRQAVLSRKKSKTRNYSSSSSY